MVLQILLVQLAPFAPEWWPTLVRNIHKMDWYGIANPPGSAGAVCAGMSVKYFL